MKEFFTSVLIVFFAALLIFAGWHTLFDAEEPAKDITVSTAAVSGEGGYYEQLSDIEKEAYDVMLSSFSEGKSECVIGALPLRTVKSDLKRVTHAVLYDNPDIFWLNGSYSATYLSDREENLAKNIEVEFETYQFWTYSSDPQRYYDETVGKADEIAALASGFSTDYEKAEFLFKYLVDHTEYDNERLNEFYKTIHSSTCELIFTPYACLVEGRAVCAGYAKAYKMLLDRCGVDCRYVTGYAGSEGHAWNCIRLDDKEFYFADPTWGDGKFQRTDGTVMPDTVKFEYFGMTEGELQLTHTLDTELLSLPDCRATKYNYFVYNHLVADSFDLDTAVTVIERQQDRSPAMIRFTSDSAFNDAISSLTSYKVNEQLETRFGKEIIVFSNESKRIVYLFRAS